MTLFNYIIIYISKALIFLLRILKSGGTSLPGKIALKIYPMILKKLAKDKRIIVVTGTNGKTTTTKIINTILVNNGYSVTSNHSGANLLSGITTCLINSYPNNSDFYLLEIDEAAFSIATNHFEPELIVVTNFFRDQLDRYGELYSTLNKVKKGISQTKNTKIILNGDDSLCASIGKDFKHKTFYYGLTDNIDFEEHKSTQSDASYCIYCQTKYTYQNHIYGHLGHFKCPNCGYEKPKLDFSVNKILELEPTHSKIELIIDNEIIEAFISLPAIYNIYNALAAYSVSEILSLDKSKSLKALSSFQSSFGRMETINIENKNLRILLVKNPTGFSTALDYLRTDKSNHSICFIINDNIADGQDISWLWDVEFEMLYDHFNHVNSIFVSGKRAQDMALRLKYMDVPTNKIKIVKDYKELVKISLESILPNQTVYIFPTYTALLEIRKYLSEQYKIKEFWK